MSVTILTGDCRDVLRQLPDASVNCCVTSPPYWGLRDYGVSGQLGLEQSPDEYVTEMVGVFREVRRALRDDGTAWVNLGDSYIGAAGGGQGQNSEFAKRSSATYGVRLRIDNRAGCGLKPKDMAGIPWRVAFALQNDGWWLRQDIIWHKPNPMPESITDRCTKSHEYIFLLSKAERYYFDSEAIKENSTGNAHRRTSNCFPSGWVNGCGEHTAIWLQKNGVHRKTAKPGNGIKANSSFESMVTDIVEFRNKRSVWTVPTHRYNGAHFATFPPQLIAPCILAGCPQGGTVLDPFGGSGTTGEVAEGLGRNSILIELNPEYVKLAENRTAQGGLFCQEFQTGEARQ
jgi:DNA modification methylase